MREEVLYAHNWEDGDIETAALAIDRDDDVIAIAGGGCTALSLLAERPRRLHVVDRNPAQIHLLELKRAAVGYLPGCKATGFLGGRPCHKRREAFEFLVDHMPAEASAFWRAHIDDIESGVLSRGRIERYFAIVRWIIRQVHPATRIEALFEQPSLDAQARFYDDVWNTAGWRALFLLGHKAILGRALDPSFYRHVNPESFPADVRSRFARAMTEMPIADNYFLSWILRGRYSDRARGKPRYLQDAARSALAAAAGALETHVADLGDFLRSRPDSSCDKFYLSNVTEWLPEEQVAPLLREVIRVARDGATVCYRALMADRPLPVALREQLVEDERRSHELFRADRACVNAAFHVVTVRKISHD